MLTSTPRLIANSAAAEDDWKRAKLDNLALSGNLLIVAVGSPANGTFNVLPVAIQPAD